MGISVSGPLQVAGLSQDEAETAPAMPAVDYAAMAKWAASRPTNQGHGTGYYAGPDYPAETTNPNLA
jgi:hypothetical protein